MVWSQLAGIRTPPIVTTDFLYIRFIRDRTIYLLYLYWLLLRIKIDGKFQGVTSFERENYNYCFFYHDIHHCILTNILKIYG